MYCELCELQMSPDQIPGSPLTPHSLRPIANSSAPASPTNAAPAVAQTQSGSAGEVFVEVPVLHRLIRSRYLEFPSREFRLRTFQASRASPAPAALPPSPSSP